MRLADSAAESPMHEGSDVTPAATEPTPRLRPAVGVGTMILRDSRVLLGRRRGRHAAGTFAWPGGHVEFGESLEEAAAREVFEEAGMTVTSTELLCVSNVRDREWHYVDFQFLVEADGEPVLKEPHRVESWDWYELTDLPGPLFRCSAFGLQSYRTKRFYNP